MAKNDRSRRRSSSKGKYVAHRRYNLAKARAARANRGDANQDGSEDGDIDSDILDSSSVNNSADLSFIAPVDIPSDIEISSDTPIEPQAASTPGRPCPHGQTLRTLRVVPVSEPLEDPLDESINLSFS